MNQSGNGESNMTSEKAIDGTLTNGRLRRRPRDGEPSVIQISDFKLGQWGAVGGRLYVDDVELHFAGTELIVAKVGDLVRPDKALKYGVTVPGRGIESVSKRVGFLFVPYVSVKTTDGGELYFRMGALGSKSDLLVKTVQALIDQSV